MNNPILTGQKVRVYSDPITQTKLEGIAEVIAYRGATMTVNDFGEVLHLCTVRFQECEPGEPDVIRNVPAENIVVEEEQ